MPTSAQRVPRRLTVVVLVLLLGAATVGCEWNAAIRGVQLSSLRYRTSATDYAKSSVLDFAKLSGKVYVHLPTPSNVGKIAKVEFFVDDPGGDRAPVNVETVAPYDFIGAGRAWNTDLLSAGTHRLTARWTATNGKEGVTTAVFTVRASSSTTTTTTRPPTTTTTTRPPTTTTTTRPPTTTTTASANPSGFTLSASWFRANTGPRVAPTKTRSGSFTAADAGKTFDGYVFNGGISANGVDNVTIRNSVVRGRVAMGYGEATGWRFEYTEIDGSSVTGNQSTIGDQGFTLHRVNLHHGSNGVRWSGGITITESWVHDFYEDMSGSHRSCIGSNGDTSTTLIARNWIDCSADIRGLSGALVMYGDFGPIRDVTIDGNYIDGSGSYILYAGSLPKPYPTATGLVIRGNRFGRHYNYGPVTGWNSAGNVWTDNRFMDNGALITP